MNSKIQFHLHDKKANYETKMLLSNLCRESTQISFIESYYKILKLLMKLLFTAKH